jgi:hypothetical protein
MTNNRVVKSDGGIGGSNGGALSTVSVLGYPPDSGKFVTFD